jgi:hypothetical protein
LRGKDHRAHLLLELEERFNRLMLGVEELTLLPRKRTAITKIGGESRLGPHLRAWGTAHQGGEEIEIAAVR